jgi:hypothetical protein
MRLTSIERNQIFQAIAQSTLDPAECVYEERAKTDGVRHASGSIIDIQVVAIGHKTRDYALIRFVVDGRTFQIIHLSNIEKAMPYITEWADETRLISSAPDLWAEMQRSRELIADMQRTDSSNMHFTQDEQEQIAAHLQQIKKQVKEQFALPNEQMEHVEEKLDEAAEASKRMGRKDWFLLFSGTIFTLIVSDIVTPAVAEHIFTMAVQALIHLLIGGSGPPQILA